MKVMRQSLMSAADTCAKRVQYHMDPNVRAFTASEYTVFGTGYHAGVEALYLGEDLQTALVVAENAFHHEVSLNEELHPLWTWDDFGGSEGEACDRLMALLEKYPARMWDLTKFKVLNTELPFDFEFRPGWLAHGTIDLVLEATDAVYLTCNDFEMGPKGRYERYERMLLLLPGDHVIVDHKTAKKPWQRGKESVRITNQPAWYTHWYRQHCLEVNGYAPRRIWFFFDVATTDGKSFERRYSPVTERDEMLVLQKANDLARLCDNDGPYLPSTDSPLCSQRWCGFWDLCEYGGAETSLVLSNRGA